MKRLMVRLENKVPVLNWGGPEKVMCFCTGRDELGIIQNIRNGQYKGDYKDELWDALIPVGPEQRYIQKGYHSLAELITRLTADGYSVYEFTSLLEAAMYHAAGQMIRPIRL